MLHLLQMGSSKVLTTFPLQIQSSWQLSLLELPPPRRNTVTSSSDSSDTYTSIVQSGPPFTDAALSRHLVSKPHIPHLPILYLLPLPLHHRPLLLAFLLCLMPSLLPLTLSGFFNGMLEVFEPGALSYFTFSRPILSILSASRNPIITLLPLSGFLDSLLCVLIAPTPGLAFTLLMPRTLAVVSSFSSGRAYPSLNFLLPSFFARSLLLLCRGQHLSSQLLLAVIS